MNPNNKRTQSMQSIECLKKKVKSEPVHDRNQQIKHVRYRNTSLWQLSHPEQVTQLYQLKVNNTYHFGCSKFVLSLSVSTIGLENSFPNLM